MTRTYALIAGPLLAALISCNDGVSTHLDFIVTPEEVSLPAPTARLGYATKSIFITNISGRDVTLSRVRLKEADETSELTLRAAERPLEDAQLKLAKGQSLALEVRWRIPVGLSLIMRRLWMVGWMRMWLVMGWTMTVMGRWMRVNLRGVVSLLVR